MFDDCIIVDVRLGEQLVFVRGQAINLPPSRSELRRMFEDLRDLDDLSTVVRELTGERLDDWSGVESREDRLDRAADLLAHSGCRVLTNDSRRSFTGRAPHTGRARAEDRHIPMLSDLAPREPTPRAADFFVEFVVTTDDGVAIADAQFEVKNRRGFATRCKSDARGRVRTVVPLDELYAIRLLADVALPPLPADGEAKPTHGVAFGGREDDSLEISVNRRHILVIPREAAIVVPPWLEVQFVDPWWRPFSGVAVELELPDGEIVRRKLDADARLRVEALPGPKRACRAWLPADAVAAHGLSAVVRPANGETGHTRPGGSAIQLPAEIHNVIRVEVPHVPSC
jgi:hypothetical protein